MKRMAVVFGTALACGSSAAAAAAPTRYVGLCDASAAVALSPDHFVVADDEHDVLTIYRRGQEVAVSRLDLADHLGNRKPGGKLKEADIEGAARIGDRIYWISSHGRDKHGDREPSRLRFFATEVLPSSGAVPALKLPAAPPYKNLLQDLAVDPRFQVLTDAAAAPVAPESPGGLNIEGLAATPQGQLLIGFRNPRPQGLALVLPLRNPRAVIDSGARPVFGDLIRLDLGQRGIRSLEWVESRYLIVAGPFDDGDHGGPGSDFALFTWSGASADRPKRVPGIAFGSLNPEALFAIPGTHDIELLSDDGGVKVGGVACKSDEVPAKKKSFRALRVTLP